jgi:hypothetical protein
METEEDLLKRIAKYEKHLARAKEYASAYYYENVEETIRTNRERYNTKYKNDPEYKKKLRNYYLKKKQLAIEKKNALNAKCLDGQEVEPF